MHFSIETFKTTGRMRDVSSDGVGVIVDGESEKRLARVVQVSVTFLLPGQGRPLTFEAWICKRFRLDDENAVCYGLSWDPAGSSDFASQQQRVTDYVMTRQRELLQSRVEISA